MKNKKLKKQKTLLVIGALFASILPMACNGKRCDLILDPDLPTKFPYIPFDNNSTIKVSALSGTIATFPDPIK